MGGSFASLVKRNAAYKRIADAICDDLDPDGVCCLLCGWESGSRWHALLRCPLVEVGLGDLASPLRHSLYAFAEAVLGAADLPFEDVPLETGETIRAYRRPHCRACEDSELVAKYPLLHSVGWLLPSVDDQGMAAEDADVAARGLLPRCLATVLAKGPHTTKPRDLAGAAAPAPIPWRARPQARLESRAKAAEAQAQWSKPRDLLIGVVLHLAVLRSRYMAALAERCRLWHERKGTPLPAAATRRGQLSVLRPGRHAAPSLRLPLTPAAKQAAAAMRALSELPTAYPSRSAPLI